MFTLRTVPAAIRIIDSRATTGTVACRSLLAALVVTTRSIATLDLVGRTFVVIAVFLQPLFVVFEEVEDFLPGPSVEASFSSDPGVEPVSLWPSTSGRSRNRTGSSPICA